ncbi:hypothetical protein [Melittangium boletus]|uniref:hypothetical protein n=1 Tax=Melittangium boletus TaxID=83453 RepID=UPI003DA32533
MLPLMAALGLATAMAVSAQPGPGGRTDLIQMTPQDDIITLRWSDTEERLVGTLRPAPPRKGEPFKLALDVGSFEGAPFEGPLILTLRPGGTSGGETRTVKRQGRHWEATFTPEQEGPYQLDVFFQTTRNKSLHGTFDVASARIPRQWAWGLLIVGALALVGYTVVTLLKGNRADASPLPHRPALSPSPCPDTPPSRPPSPPRPRPNPRPRQRLIPRATRNLRPRRP